MLLTICLYMSPGGVTTMGLKIPINDWFNNLRYSTITHFKVANFGSIDTKVLRHIPNYWMLFKPYLKQLSSATWQCAPTMTGGTS